MSALTALSRHLPVSVVDFGNVGPGVSAGVPLRYADLSRPARRPTRRGRVRAIGALGAGRAGGHFRPVRTVPVVLPDGQAVLRVEFAAPSPLEMSGS